MRGTESAMTPEPIAAPRAVPASWWRDWNRAAVLAAIEDAAGAALAVNDPLPDTLIAAAQAFGLAPVELHMWIFDRPKQDWSVAELRAWARRYGFARAEQPGADAA